MTKVIDLECNLPTAEMLRLNEDPTRQSSLGSGDTFRGIDAKSISGHGMVNYLNIFGPSQAARAGLSIEQFDEMRATMPAEEVQAELRRLNEHPMELGEFVHVLNEAGVEHAVIGTTTGPGNQYIAEVASKHPDKFVAFARISPWDGMAGVRELERLVRDYKMRGLAMAAFRERIPANDRRYYPLYAKCVELNIPVRLYSSMSYATDRPYDLGHPRALDDVCCDFPELTVIAGLGGWPWVNEMVALSRRHPNLYVDTAAHRPRHFTTPGSGWEALLQFGNTLIQDKVMVGLSALTLNQPYSTLIGEILALPLKDSVKEKWLYGNAARVLSLS
ncbi:MAG: amidohydrolase family protein [Dehalococcoidia bacterium]